MHWSKLGHTCMKSSWNTKLPLTKQLRNKDRRSDEPLHKSSCLITTFSPQLRQLYFWSSQRQQRDAHIYEFFHQMFILNLTKQQFTSIFYLKNLFWNPNWVHFCISRFTDRSKNDLHFWADLLIREIVGSYMLLWLVALQVLRKILRKY